MIAVLLTCVQLGQLRGYESEAKEGQYRTRGDV